MKVRTAATDKGNRNGAEGDIKINCSVSSLECLNLKTNNEDSLTEIYIYQFPKRNPLERCRNILAFVMLIDDVFTLPTCYIGYSLWFGWLLAST